MKPDVSPQSVSLSLPAVNPVKPPTWDKKLLLVGLVLMEEILIKEITHFLLHGAV